MHVSDLCWFEFPCRGNPPFVFRIPLVWGLVLAPGAMTWNCLLIGLMEASDNSVFFEGLGQSSREEFSNPGDAVSLSFLCYNNGAVGMKPMLVKPLRVPGLVGGIMQTSPP